MNELAVKLEIQARTVTGFVDALEKENLLVSIPDPKDRKATLIRLTELAHAHLNEALEQQAVIAEQLLQNLTMTQRKELSELLLLLNNGNDLFPICSSLYYRNNT